MTRSRFYPHIVPPPPYRGTTGRHNPTHLGPYPGLPKVGGGGLIWGKVGILGGKWTTKNRQAKQINTQIPWLRACIFFLSARKKCFLFIRLCFYCILLNTHHMYAPTQTFIHAPTGAHTHIHTPIHEFIPFLPLSPNRPSFLSSQISYQPLFCTALT